MKGGTTFGTDVSEGAVARNLCSTESGNGAATPAANGDSVVTRIQMGLIQRRPVKRWHFVARYDDDSAVSGCSAVRSGDLCPLAS